MLTLLLFLSSIVASVNAEVYDRYAGYEPTTSITDYAAIDLDQEVLNQEIGNLTLENAWWVYVEGGHSGSYADITITNITEAGNFPKGTIVRGLNIFNQDVTGTLLEDVSWKDNGTSTVAIKVLYDVLPIQSEYSDCQVGGFYRFQAAERQGCYLANGELTFESTTGDDLGKFTYFYDNREGNKNLITIQNLSTNASITMKGPDGAFYKEFEVFRAYYGDTNYGDKWITAAKAKTNTAFSSGRGNSDFTVLLKRDGQGDAMGKGSAYLNIWMEVVRYLNEAVVNCRNGTADAASAVDKAVAYYAGSRTTEENSEGVLMYALAEIRAQDVNNAFVNPEIFRQFNLMRDSLIANNASLCDQVEQSKDQIFTMMQVPLVQSILRYAYIQSNEPPERQEDLDKIDAEGATFTATMLPFFHECDSQAAEIVHSHMRLGVIANFTEVKKTMESTYRCLNITIENVGGSWKKEVSATSSGWIKSIRTILVTTVVLTFRYLL